MMCVLPHVLLPTVSLLLQTDWAVVCYYTHLLAWGQCTSVYKNISLYFQDNQKFTLRWPILSCPNAPCKNDSWTALQLSGIRQSMIQISLKRHFEWLDHGLEKVPLGFTKPLRDHLGSHCKVSKIIDNYINFQRVKNSDLKKPIAAKIQLLNFTFAFCKTELLIPVWFTIG
jgi:hypothetical protein